jgi:hypothetical protein
MELNKNKAHVLFFNFKSLRNKSGLQTSVLSLHIRFVTNLGKYQVFQTIFIIYQTSPHTDDVEIHLSIKSLGILEEPIVHCQSLQSESSSLQDVAGNKARMGALQVF